MQRALERTQISKEMPEIWKEAHVTKASKAVIRILGKTAQTAWRLKKTVQEHSKGALNWVQGRKNEEWKSQLPGGKWCHVES